MSFFGCSSGDSDSSFDQRGYSNTDKLVSAEWLNENLENVKIIDVRKAEEYDSGHIPGAVRIDSKRSFSMGS